MASQAMRLQSGSELTYAIAELHSTHVMIRSAWTQEKQYV